jgi:hypothetical protein
MMIGCEECPVFSTVRKVPRGTVKMVTLSCRIDRHVRDAMIQDAVLLSICGIIFNKPYMLFQTLKDAMTYLLKRLIEEKCMPLVISI